MEIEELPSAVLALHVCNGACVQRHPPPMISLSRASEVVWRRSWVGILSGIAVKAFGFGGFGSRPLARDLSRRYGESGMIDHIAERSAQIVHSLGSAMPRGGRIDSDGHCRVHTLDFSNTPDGVKSAADSPGLDQ